MTVTFAAPDLRVRLGTDLADAVKHYSANAPRSRQRRIGPSEIGHACLRRVGYSALGYEPVHHGGDPWPAFVGTGVHAELAAALTADNIRLGRTRWLVEHRVTVSGAITGTADVFDTDTASVIDHKVLGASTLSALRASGDPGDQYRTQVHLYGYGFAAEGREVRNVAIAAWPRAGLMHGRIVWAEPYDAGVADKALERLASVVSLAGVLDVDDHPDRWAHVPATPGPNCDWCPFWSPDGAASDRDHGRCPGSTS